MSRSSLSDLWGSVRAPFLDVAELSRVLQQLRSNAPSRGTISDAQAAELLSAGRHLLSQPCSVQRDSALTSVLNLLSLWRGRAATREQLSAGVNLGSAHWQIVAGAQQLAQELVTLEGHASTSTCKLPDILALLAACSLGAPQHLAHASWALAADALVAPPAVETVSGLLEQWEQLLPTAALLLRACMMQQGGGVALGWLSAALLVHLEACLAQLLTSSTVAGAQDQRQHRTTTTCTGSSSSSSQSSGSSSSTTSGMDAQRMPGTQSSLVASSAGPQGCEGGAMRDLAYLTVASAMLVDFGQQLVAPGSSRGQPPTLPLSPAALCDLLRDWQYLGPAPGSLLRGVVAAAVATGFCVQPQPAVKEQPQAQMRSWELVMAGAAAQLAGCVGAAAAASSAVLATDEGFGRVQHFVASSLGWCLAQQHRACTTQTDQSAIKQDLPVEGLAAAMCCCSALMCCCMEPMPATGMSSSSSGGDRSLQAAHKHSNPSWSGETAGPPPAAAAASGLHRLTMGAPAVAAALAATAQPLPLLQQALVVNALAIGVQRLVGEASERATASGGISSTLQRCFIAVSLVLMRLQQGVSLALESGGGVTKPDVQQHGGSSNHAQHGAAAAGAAVVADSLMALLHLAPYRVDVPGYVDLVTGLVAQLTQLPEVAAAFLDDPLLRSSQLTQALPVAVVLPLLPLAATAMCCLVRAGRHLPPKGLTLLVGSLRHPDRNVAAAAAGAYADVLAAAVDKSCSQDVARTVPAALQALLDQAGSSSSDSGSGLGQLSSSAQALHTCWPSLLQVCRGDPALALWSCEQLIAACLQLNTSTGDSSAKCTPRSSASLEGVLLSSPLFISLQQLPDVLQLLDKFLGVMPAGRRSQALSGVYQRVLNSDDVPRKLPLLRWLQQQVQAAGNT